MKTILYFSFYFLIFCTSYSQYYTSSQLDSIDGNKLAAEGDMYLDTLLNKYYLGLSNGRLGKMLPYNESICDLLKPNVNEKTYKIGYATNMDIVITGYNFSDSTGVLINSATVNSITVNGNTELTVNITSGNTNDSSDIVVFNSCGNDTIKNGLITVSSTWKDLRLGGDAFTMGNGAGNDIRYRGGMTPNRNANGMYFTGQNPWNSWVKFEGCQYPRGPGVTTEWIFVTDGAFILGISGINTDETSGNQFSEGAVMAYFSSSTNFWGLYGSSPASGTVWSQASAAGITDGSVLKLKIEGDGSIGQRITLYQLASAAPANWDDESNVISTMMSTNNNLQSPLVPFIIPRSSANNYFVALRVL